MYSAQSLLLVNAYYQAATITARTAIKPPCTFAPERAFAALLGADGEDVVAFAPAALEAELAILAPVVFAAFVAFVVFTVFVVLAVVFADAVVIVVEALLTLLVVCAVVLDALLLADIDGVPDTELTEATVFLLSSTK